jgi:Xaa-Pro aminopeptidase
MGRAVDAVERTMAATTPLVVPGVSMAELAEAVEHELRLAGSQCPSFATHIFTGLSAGDLDSETAAARQPIAEGTSVIVRLRRRRRRLLVGLRPYDLRGEPPADYLAAHEVMLAAQEAGHAKRPSGRRWPRGRSRSTAGARC